MNVREWALPVYTILMQFAVGTLFVLWCMRSANMRGLSQAARDRILRKPILVVVFATVVAIVGSHFHLSRPVFSFLAVLNFEQSWLSREVVFTVVLLWLCSLLGYLIWFRPGRGALKTALGWAAVAVGFTVVLCMSALYLIPTQPSWNTPLTILLFYGTTLLLGAISAVALLIMDSVFSEAQEPKLAATRYHILQKASVWCGSLAIGVLVAIVILNAYQIAALAGGDLHAQTSLQLLVGVYGPLLGVRFVASLAGGGVLILALVGILRRRKRLVDAVVPIHLACLLVIVGEILGRFLFYATHVRVGV